MDFKNIFSFNKKSETCSKTLTSIKSSWDLYETMPLPFCIVVKDDIIHSNEMFKSTFSETEDSKLKSIFKNLDLNESKQLIRYNKTSYNVNVKLHKSSEVGDIYMVFFNESIYKDQLDNIVEQEMCVCYIILDNYDEAFENVEDIKVPVILAIIERRLNSFAASLNGIIRKYEKDRFMLIFAKEQLEYLKNNNFSIQAQIKEIDLGLKTPITISMGIGHSADSLAIISDYAMSALDLALGRGGDQVVIKTDTKYEYFGESRQEASQNNRVKARVKAHAFAELIMDYDKIMIMGHVNPDLDSLGSAIGIYKIVKSINVSADCKIVLGDNITTSISGLYDSLVENKEYKENVFINNKKATANCDNKTLLVIVDVYRQAITQCPNLFDITDNVVIFDHHRKSSDYIKGERLVYHNSASSSTCELVTEMMMYVKKSVRLLPVEADALLSGITVDTKNFTFKTSSKTFECAAFLKNRGADSHNVHLFLQNDFDVYKARANAITHSSIYRDNVAYTIISEVTVNPNLVVAQTADELLNLKFIKSSFVLCRINDETIVSFRSFGDLNVQLIAEHFGGGGHRTVAACKIQDLDIDEIIEIIKIEIDKQIEEDN